MILGSIKMVQIIEMPRKRSIGEAIGQGLGEGFSRGVDAALQDISYEKRLSIQARQQMMLEEQREAKQDQKIWKAANVMAFSKGYPDTAAALFSMEKASPGFLAKVNDQWAPNDWVRLDEHLRQYSSDDQINRSQGGGTANPPPLAQTGGAQVGGAQNARSAIQSTNINPRDPLINQAANVQPGANMMPPSPFPDVNKARANQAIEQTQVQPQGQTQQIANEPIQMGRVQEQTPEEMTYAQKIAYNNANYPRKIAQQMNAQARAEESLKYQKSRAESAKESASLKRRIYEESKNEPFRKKVNDLRDKVIKEQTSLDLAESAIKTGDTSSLVQWYANQHDLDFAKTPASVILGTAAKEFLTGGVKSLGSKGVNQFIEKRMLSMFPVVGQSEEANLSLVEALRFQVALDNKKIELYDKYEELYHNNPSKIEKEVFNDLNKYANEEKERLAYKLSEIRDDFATRSELASTKKAIPGSFITQKRADVLKEKAHGDGKKAQEAARKMGYKFPGEE